MATLSSCLTAQTALFVTPSHVHFFSFCFLEMTRAPIFSTLKLTHPISPVCKNHPDIPIFLQVNSSPHTISITATIIIIVIIIIIIVITIIFIFNILSGEIYHQLGKPHNTNSAFSFTLIKPKS